MKLELLTELHPSTCEHDRCPPFICKEYKDPVDLPIKPIATEDVYVVDESTLQRVLPKKKSECELCRVTLEMHTEEICLVLQAWKKGKFR